MRVTEYFAKKFTTKDLLDQYDLAYEIAQMVIEARLIKGLTQEELAEKVGTHQSSIARLEAGNTLPSLSFLEKIADSLGTILIAPRFGFMKDSLHARKSRRLQGAEMWDMSGAPNIVFKTTISGSGKETEDANLEDGLDQTSNLIYQKNS